jgi:flagellar basal body-associated protein FliL
LRNHRWQVDKPIARREASNRMSILWIILIVILVLALLGFFSRGRW